MRRLTFVAVLLIALNTFQVCTASNIFGLFDYLTGKRQSKVDIMHTLNGIRNNPEVQCRAALSVKDHEYVSFLAHSMPTLNDLVTKKSEFVEDLSHQEQVDILKLYFEKFCNGQEVCGEALVAIMTVICRDHRVDLLNLALMKCILNQREVIIFFLKYQSLFMEFIKAGILEYLDITEPIIAGKGLLHILAETGKVNLFKEIISQLLPAVIEEIKGNSLTQIEKDSILHSAVISDDPQMIHEAVKTFSKFCGHHNSYSMSPLKLALVNGNSFESVKVLIDNDCVVEGDNIKIKSLDEGYEEFFYHEMKDSLDKMAKWAPCQVDEFRETFKAAFDAIHLHDSSRMIKDALFIGLLNSYRRFNSNLDRILDEDYISSPYSRSRSQSQSSPDNRTRTNYWLILSDKLFDPENGIFIEKVPLASILNGMNFSVADKEVKRLVLSNLAKFDSESIDYTGVNLFRFINILISFGDPEVFGHFVNRDIDYYFCIRAMIKQFKDYGELIPFLEAIHFHVDQPFIDGLFPIHLAVISNKVDLVQFLLHNEANLYVATLYEQNNAMHFGLRDSSSRDMADYLFRTAPGLVLIPNIYDDIPLETVMYTTEKFENIKKIIPVLRNNCNFHMADISVELVEIFTELMKMWPLNSSTDQYFKDDFYKAFMTSVHDCVARYLLSFISKKILKHLIKERGTLNMKLIGESNLSASPTVSDNRWSP